MKEAELPPGWAWSTLGEIAQVNPATDLSNLTDDAEISFVPMASVEEETGRLDPTQTRQYSELRRKSLTKFQEGDLLFAKITPCMENGKIALASALVGGFGFGSTEFHVVRPTSGISGRYLLHFLLQKSVRIEAERNMTGAVGQRRIPTGYLRELKVPVPPLAEQERIVDALEDQLSRLAKALEYARGAAVRMPELRHSAMSSILESGKNSPTWNIFRIGDIATVGTGSTPSKSRSDYYLEGAIPWVTSSQIDFGLIRQANQFITERALKETSVRIFPPGSILIAMYGEGKTRGKSAELAIAATTNQACAAVVLHPEHDSCRPWIRAVLEFKYETLRKLAVGGVQPNLNLGVVRDIKIPMPSVDEQQAILDELDKVFSVVGVLERETQSAIARARALRRALLLRAFSGKLVPQDPADEPASVLMGRIRAERAAQEKPKRGRVSKKASAVSARPAPPPASGPAGTFVQEELGL